MDYIIKNSKLKAVISSNGAELRELYDSNNVNRMHTPSSKTWNRVSPILFPQVSRIKGGIYYVENKPYEMPAHGFFRNMDITPIKQEEDSITFAICDNEETLKMYPYNFEFEVNYKLDENSLVVTFNVINKSNKEMLFMLGGHPGFKIPLYDNESYNDYYLKFENKETVDAMQVVDGFLANVYKPCLQNENIINLSHEMFDPDAIVMRGLTSSYVDLLSQKNDSCIRFYFSDFEILAVWSLQDENANYVCLEPWNGIQKDFVLEHEKMGVLKLNANETKIFSYTIEIIK